MFTFRAFGKDLVVGKEGMELQKCNEILQTSKWLDFAWGQPIVALS